jgi:hypothetical protein
MLTLAFKKVYGVLRQSFAPLLGERGELSVMDNNVVAGQSILLAKKGSPHINNHKQARTMRLAK